MTKICQGVVDRGQKLTTTENKMADLSLKLKNYQENCAKSEEACRAATCPNVEKYCYD